MHHRGPGPGFGPGFGPPGFGGPGPGFGPRFGFDGPRPGFGFDGPRPGFDYPGPRFGFDGPRPRFDGPGPRFDPAPNVSSPNIPQVNQGNTDSHNNYIEEKGIIFSHPDLGELAWLLKFSLSVCLFVCLQGWGRLVCCDRV